MLCVLCCVLCVGVVVVIVVAAAVVVGVVGVGVVVFFHRGPPRQSAGKPSCGKTMDTCKLACVETRLAELIYNACEGSLRAMKKKKRQENNNNLLTPN